jgi:hypothetical protein
MELFVLCFAAIVGEGVKFRHFFPLDRKKTVVLPSFPWVILNVGAPFDVDQPIKECSQPT